MLEKNDNKLKIGIDLINLPNEVFESSCEDLKQYKLSPILYLHSNRNLERGLPGFQYGRPPGDQDLLLDEESHNDTPMVKLDFVSVQRIAPRLPFTSRFTSRNSGHKLIDPLGVYYYHNFPVGQRAELLLDLSAKNHPRFVVNRTYSLWANLRSTYYELPGKILSDLTTVTLGEAGYIPLHCAAIAKEHSAVLIWGPPDIGKTITVWKLTSEKMFNFMSEDITFTDGLRCFACPYTTSGLPRELKHSKRSLLQILTEKLFPYTCVKPRIVDYLSRSIVESMATVSHIIVLARGNRSISLLRPDQALDLLLRLNRLEFQHFGSRLLSFMEYHFGYPNLQALLELEVKILKKLTRNCQQIVQISAPTPEEYAKQIADIVAL